MHVLCFAAYERFIGLNFTGERAGGIASHH